MALFWHFLGYDMAVWMTTYYSADFTPPKLDGTGDLLTVALSLLGLGGLRTLEKVKGVSR